jgi:pimeloyl-ACP methyl ester carboxylesterase
LAYAEPQEPAARRLAQGEHLAPLGEVSLWYRVRGHGPYLVVSSVTWGLGSLYLQAPGGISPLEDHYTVIYVNTRGTDPSTRPADASRMATADMVDDLEHLRQYLGLATMSLVGHSAGGTLVLGYAERYPDRVKKLVLIDARALGYPRDRTRQILAEWKTDPRYSQAIANRDKPYPDTDDGATAELIGILDLYFHDPKTYAPVFARTVTNKRLIWVDTASRKADAARALPETNDLPKVKAKTLVLSGRFDWICPLEEAQLIHAGIAGSQLVVFDQTGHIPWIEERDRFFAVVREFLHD